MSKVTSNLNMSEYVSMAQIKRKLKSHLVELGCNDFKISSYGKGLVCGLVMVLEEILSDTIKYVSKDETNGLYKLNQGMIHTVINENTKYYFMLKYVKKYVSNIKYHDSVFFNIKKVLDNLESKYGSKLFVEHEARNYLSYIILSIQYELVDLSVRMVKYSKKRTLGVSVLGSSISFIIPQEISSKIELKLDGLDDEKNIEVEVDGDAEAEQEEESENDEEA